MEKIAVIGAGTMGNGIAHVFAQFEYDVTLIDIDQKILDRALTTIEKNLNRQLKKGVSAKTSLKRLWVESPPKQKSNKLRML